MTHSGSFFVDTNEGCESSQGCVLRVWGHSLLKKGQGWCMHIGGGENEWRTPLFSLVSVSSHFQLNLLPNFYLFYFLFLSKTDLISIHPSTHPSIHPSTPSPPPPTHTSLAPVSPSIPVVKLSRYNLYWGPLGVSNSCTWGPSLIQNVFV